MARLDRESDGKTAALHKRHCSGGGEGKRIWLTAGDLGEAMGSDDGGDGNHGIVAEVEEETGDDGAGVGTGKGEDDTDQNEQADDAPGPAELRAVHQTEEDSGKQNAGNDAEGFREQRIEIAAEDGFLDERGDEDSHGHEQHGSAAILEDLFNGHLVVGVYLRADDENKNGQAAAREEVRPGIGFAGGEIGFQFFPAERRPEGFAAQNAEGYVEKEKNGGVPEDIGAKKKLRLVEQIALEVLGGHAAMRRVVQNQSRLYEKETGESEENKNEEMRPGPGNAQVFRQRWPRSVGRGSACSVADGVACQPEIGIFRGKGFGCRRK